MEKLFQNFLVLNHSLIDEFRIKNAPSSVLIDC